MSGRRDGTRAGDPFAVLGLDSAAELTDDDVRNAWRKIAAATHPDRADGGDPARFASAAAAYTDLRTPFGRGEAKAGLAAGPAAGGRLPSGDRHGRLAKAVRAGRPGRLILRVAGAAAVSIVALIVTGHGPAGPALVVGALTWLILTGRHDIPLTASPPPRATASAVDSSKNSVYNQARGGAVPGDACGQTSREP